MSEISPLPHARITHEQASPFNSPHTLQKRIGILLWGAAWKLFCEWTPKPLNPWRLFWLRAFGATIEGKPFVHQKARVHIPSNLILRDRACLGEGAVAYTQGVIELEARATVAQEAYLCTGSHDFSDPDLPLVTAPIVIGEDAFIGVRALILPGVRIGAGCVVGGASVVTKNMPEWTIAAGNPCRVLRPREQAGIPAP